jgi:alkylation response protein AidB-like acyl-CoA dehydrogenase
MDFDLSEEQRAWQAKARKFAREEIRPISLERDAIEDPAKTWDWEIIRKGSKLGFRTMAVPREWGGLGTDFVTQALVMTELARADSAISKAFSQCWKWSHLIAASCTEEQKRRFLKPFLADDTFVLGKGISEHSAGSDNRLPPADDPKAGLKLRAERRGDEWILNGEKAFIANGSIGKLFFIDARTDRNAPLKQNITMFLVPRDTRASTQRQVYTTRAAGASTERRDDLRERARAARQRRRQVNGAVKKSGGGAAYRRGPVRRPGARRQRVSGSATTPARSRSNTPARRSRAGKRCSSSSSSS